MKVESVFGLKILVELFKEDIIEEKDSGLFVVENKAVKPLVGKVFMLGGQVGTELANRGDDHIDEGDVILYDRTDYPVISSGDKDYHKIFLDNVQCKVVEEEL